MTEESWIEVADEHGQAMRVDVLPHQCPACMSGPISAPMPMRQHWNMPQRQLFLFRCERSRSCSGVFLAEYRTSDTFELWTLQQLIDGESFPPFPRRVEELAYGSGRLFRQAVFAGALGLRDVSEAGLVAVLRLVVDEFYLSVRHESTGKDGPLWANTLALRIDDVVAHPRVRQLVKDVIFDEFECVEELVPLTIDWIAGYLDAAFEAQQRL